MIFFQNQLFFQAIAVAWYLTGRLPAVVQARNGRGVAAQML